MVLYVRGKSFTTSCLRKKFLGKSNHQSPRPPSPLVLLKSQMNGLLLRLSQSPFPVSVVRYQSRITFARFARVPCGVGAHAATCGKCRVYCELQRYYFPLYNGEPSYSRTPWLDDFCLGFGDYHWYQYRYKQSSQRNGEILGKAAIIGAREMFRRGGGVGGKPFAQKNLASCSNFYERVGKKRGPHCSNIGRTDI